MSERPPHPERLVALFVTVFWAALVFAVDGLLAILLDRDPIAAGVGPYYSVIAFVIAGVVLWAVLSGTTGSRRAGFGAIAAAGLVYLVFVLVAMPWGLGLVGAQALSPFVFTAALLAGVVVVGTWWAMRRRRTR